MIFSPYSFWHFSFSISQYLIFMIKKISQSLKKYQLHLACMMKYQVWGGLHRGWHRLSVLFSISCLLPLEILTSHFFLAPAWLRMSHLVVINSWHPKKLCFLNILQFASVDPLWSLLADFLSLHLPSPGQIASWKMSHCPLYPVFPLLCFLEYLLHFSTVV